MAGIHVQFRAEFVNELCQFARLQIHLLSHKILELSEIFVPILIILNELDDGGFLCGKRVKGTRHEVGIVLNKGLVDGLFFSEIDILVLVLCLSAGLIVSLL